MTYSRKLFTENHRKSRLKNIKIVPVIFIFLSIMILTLLIPPATAEVDDELLGSGPGRFNSIVASDIDDDGRSELVFGNYDGHVTVLEYRDGDYYEEWHSPKIGTRVWGITVADFLGDDTKEIIAGNGEGEIYIYDAKSHKQVWKADELTRDVHGLLVHNLGSNDTKYLLAGTGYKTDNDLGTLYIFTKDNTTPVAKIGNFENRFRGVAVGDVDGDGKLEIVLGSGVATGENPGKGYVRVYDVTTALNPQTLLTETPIEPEWKSDNLHGDCVAIELADFTGDGYPEIVVGNGYRYQAGWVRILTYDSQTQEFIEFWKSPSDPDIGPKPYGLAVGDIDSDSKLEIVVGNQAGYIYIYEQQGAGMVEEWRSKLLGSDILGIALSDVDSDDEIEIVAAQGGYTGKGDYTSGYTNPHIYIINGRTHKTELIIGETSYLDFTMEILIIVLVITLLIGLNYFARYQRRIKDLRQEQAAWEYRTVATKDSSISTSKPPPTQESGTTEKPATGSTPISALSFTQAPAATPTETTTPQTAEPVVNDPFPPASNDPTPKPLVNDPFPKPDDNNQDDQEAS
jgi:hypothetical protein